jgi:hypothetical protein
MREEHDSNYGIVLSVWDLMFGTRKELVPNTVGLEMIEANNLVQLFCLAFVTERRFARLLHNLPRRRRRDSELLMGLSHEVQPKPPLVPRLFRTRSRRQINPDRQKLGRSHATLDCGMVRKRSAVYFRLGSPKQPFNSDLH